MEKEAKEKTLDEIFEELMEMCPPHMPETAKRAIISNFRFGLVK